MACHVNPFVVLDQDICTFILIMTTLMRDIENHSSISYVMRDVIVGVRVGDGKKSLLIFSMIYEKYIMSEFYDTKLQR